MHIHTQESGRYAPASLKDLITAFTEQCETLLKSTEKDNSTVYNDVEPKADRLDPIAKAAMVKISPFEIKSNADDPFKKIVPIGVRRAHLSYEVCVYVLMYMFLCMYVYM